MNRRFSVFSLALLFLASLFFVGGCAKKAALKEEGSAPQEAAASKSKPVAVKDDAGAKARAGKDAATKSGSEREAAKSASSLYEMADIRFDFDKYSLKEDARTALKRHAEWLAKNQKVSITIEGHCDERGTPEYNLALGERRAAEAKKYLTELGVSEKRVSTVSYGEDRPLDPGHTEEAWAKNRRDRFVSLDK